MAMRIEAVTRSTPEIHEALGRLLPQLNANLVVPDAERMNRLLNDPDVVLLVGRDGIETMVTDPDVEDTRESTDTSTGAAKPGKRWVTVLKSCPLIETVPLRGRSRGVPPILLEKSVHPDDRGPEGHIVPAAV